MIQPQMYIGQAPGTVISDNHKQMTHSIPLDDTQSLSPSTWPSSPSLNSNSTSTDLGFDVFAAFRPKPAHPNQILTRDLDDLLTKCTKADFEHFWRIRLSRHENWCRRSPAQHLAELMRFEHGSGDDTWPPEYCRISTEPTPNSSLADFIAGCKATNDDGLHHWTSRFMERWNDQLSIQLLAQEFFAQYSEQYRDNRTPERSRTVVPFLSLIRSCFEDKYGDQAARTLSSYVQESTIETFKMSWSLVRLSPIRNLHRLTL